MDNERVDEQLEAIKRRIGNLRMETFTQAEMQYLFDRIDRLEAVVSAADKLAAAARAWRDTPQVDQWSMDIEIQIHDDLMARIEEYDALAALQAGEGE